MGLWIALLVCDFPHTLHVLHALKHTLRRRRDVVVFFAVGSGVSCIVDGEHTDVRQKVVTFHPGLVSAAHDAFA